MVELTYLLLGVAFALSFISSFKFFQHWFLHGHPLIAFGFKGAFPRQEIRNLKPDKTPFLDSLGNQIPKDFKKKISEYYTGYKASMIPLRYSAEITPDKQWSRSQWKD